jgi:peptidoglycan/xylan/chitin deacetylase (PgdA/CDA1 family)/uncharacterized caspase-like protein
VAQSPSNDPLSDGIFAARNAYAIKREFIEQLVDESREEAVKSKNKQLTTATRKLLEFLSANTDLHDADWLAFNDLIDELTAIESERQLNDSDMQSLKELGDRYQVVFQRYRKDYGKSLQSLGVRGKSRETWDAYIGFLKSQYNYESLLAKYTQENARLFRYVSRGEDSAAAKQDSAHASEPQVIWGNNLPDKTVVLTFDDGPHDRNTAKILDILKQYEVNGYFFSLGKNLGSIENGSAVVGRNDAIAKRIISEGNVLANHSFSHAILTKLDEQHREEELGNTNLLLNKISGSTNSLFRPPYGSKDKSLDLEVQKDGMASVMWNIDSLDWADPVPESIVDRTMQELDRHKKGILLFHDIHKQTVAALPDMLSALSKNGYKVVTLDGRPFNENMTGLPKVPVESSAEMYGKSWAVVIGINNYQYWPKLEYAVNDAKAIAEALENKMGFPHDNIYTLTDGEATSEKIKEVMGYVLANPEKIKDNDRVFVFFAGHGMTRTIPSGKSLGYIIPSDAELDKFQNRAISMTQLSDFASMIPAKHVYFVMDSCYSGLALTRSGVSVGQSLNYINQITGRKARQILTAGGADQEVADGGPGGHSIFTWTFLQGLEGLADTDNNGYVTASELGTYVAPVVSSYSSQTPAFGNMLGSEGGDFVFKVDEKAVAEVKQNLEADESRIKNELHALRQNTSDSVRRRLDLELELENQKTKNPAADVATAVVTAPSQDVADGERNKQAKRLNASAIEFIKEKKFKEAKEELSEAARLNPYNPTIVNNYGFVLDQLNENEEALKWYYRTVELDPKRTSVYMNLGDIMVELGRPQESVAYYERYLHLYPSYKDAKLLREKIEQFKADAAKI